MVALREERRQLELKAKRIAEAIADSGRSPTLLTQLSAFESEIAKLDDRFATQQRPFPSIPGEKKIRDFVLKNVVQLRRALGEDSAAARMALMKHVQQLVLTPKQLPSGPVYEVSGTFDVIGDKDVMPLVARDGIEPPTPAFSGLGPAILILLILLLPLTFFAPETSFLLE